MHNFMSVIFLLVVAALSSQTCLGVKYEPNWNSIDSRPLPAWYDDVKIGMFINWGVYSVPSYHDEWFWYWWKGPKPIPSVVKLMEQFYPPTFTYADFAAEFKAEFYDPLKWVDIIKSSGAKYVVLSTKHHEGFTMYPSKYSFNWNSVDVGPNKDLIKYIFAYLAGSDVHFGIYHSLFEWFNPLYLQDKANNYTTQRFVKEKGMAELYEIVDMYRPDVIWSDGDWEALSTYWNATQFLAWLYNDSPVKDTVVVNDRWGYDSRCKHGGFLSCDDRFNPGKLQKRKWENAMTLDRYSWGFRRDASIADFLSMEELLETVLNTISYGGNILINVGPTGYGTISPIYEERFRQLGSWLKVNGEGIYATQPWVHQNDTVTPKVWYTAPKADKKAAYAFFINWPDNNELVLGAVSESSLSGVALVGSNKTLTWETSGTGIKVTIPPHNIVEMPCMWAWAVKLTFK
ncbi:alpha-L-fucosidase-like isoform X2 [Crassostrea angulata]|uniref:alpha-L-fucosidase-like isoform X2 n=1 Tax=Magallana angulata TaxID=2784310 RepID=UPI0022B1ECAF|nr:alpha-L-fucosidase-like isoform X2 [Crassostrea angulata]